MLGRQQCGCSGTIAIGPESVSERTNSPGDTRRGLDCNLSRLGGTQARQPTGVALGMSQGRANKEFRVSALITLCVHHLRRTAPTKCHGMAAVAQLYMGSMTFFAAHEARADSGFAWRLSSPQRKL